MKLHNILDRAVEITQNFAIVASAGTGKTFTIEHTVVRYFMTHSNPDWKSLLVVTFTKAATQDLKLRIQEALCKAIRNLETPLLQEMPDYLLPIQETEEVHRCQIIQNLKQALYSFDESQILTLHSFCAKILREHPLDTGVTFNSLEPPSFSEVKDVIKKFYHTRLCPPHYSPVQLLQALSLFRFESSELELYLIKKVLESSCVEDRPSYHELYEQFCHQLSQLSLKFHFEPEKIIEDFELQAPCYKGICEGHSKNPKEEFKTQIHLLANLWKSSDWNYETFDQVLTHGLSLIKSISPENLKAKVVVPNLYYPNFSDLLRSTIGPLVEEASNPRCILARILGDIMKLWREWQTDTERWSFQDILLLTLQAIKNPLLVSKLQKTYRLVIIDEFQDTDPLQWDIFRTLFLNSSDTYLHLVGDPKQSIYAFRQADIYTYLDATKRLGDDAARSLCVNYRSQPSLIKALNFLFKTETSPNLFSLPRLKTIHPYPLVHESERTKSHDFKDGKKALHACIAAPSFTKTSSRGLSESNFQSIETDYFFPFIIQEVSYLHHHEGLPFESCAVLVKDRFQAQRFELFCRQHHIPVYLQRTHLLTNSPAYDAWGAILQAIAEPHHIGFIKAALASQIINYNFEEFRYLTLGSKSLDLFVQQFHELQISLRTYGFGYFFQQLLSTRWGSTPCTSERILSQNNGPTLYEEFLQIGELLLQSGKTTPEGLIYYLQNFTNLEQEQLKSRPESHHDAVQVLTIHASKGLEFDIVFPLGLTRRYTQKDFLINYPSPNYPALKGPLLRPLDEESPHYLEYLEELDAEKMRQFYVACTRAKYRLYLPILDYSDGKCPKLGSASPMELFTAQIKEPHMKWEDLYQKIASKNTSFIKDFFGSLETLEVISHSIHTTPITNLGPSSNISPTFNLIPPPTPIFIPAHKLKTSFIESDCGSKNYEQLLSATDISRINLEQIVQDHKVKQTISIELQDCLRQLLKELPDHLVRQPKLTDSLQSWINTKLLTTKFAEYAERITHEIFKALNAPMLPMGLSLSRLDPNSYVRGWEFLFCEAISPKASKATHSEPYEGIIDILIYHDSKYYIVEYQTERINLEMAVQDNKVMQNFDLALLSMEVEHSQMMTVDTLERDCRSKDSVNLLSSSAVSGVKESASSSPYSVGVQRQIEALQRYLSHFEHRTFDEYFGGYLPLFINLEAAIQNHKTIPENPTIGISIYTKTT